MRPALSSVAGDVARRLPTGWRRRVLKARESLRTPTAALRVLPDVLVIGAQRSGTSSLYRYLGAHPQLTPSLRKETQYFSARYQRGERWYRRNFPTSWYRDAARAVRRRPLLAFEATPDYLFHPLAAERARALVPDARIIVLLREPASRARSHFQHTRRHGQEPLDSFAAALAAEPERLAGWAAGGYDVPATRIPANRFSYATRGEYAVQLRRWFDHFPREQFLIIDSAHLFDDPAAVLATIERFLGVRPRERRAWPNYSSASTPSAASTDDQAEADLRRAFGPSNRALVELLGHELSWTAPTAR